MEQIKEIPKAKSYKEKKYILKRKIIASLNSFAFFMCRIFPIKNNLVSVCTFEGKGGFGCNPKYIVEELHRQNPTVEFVWFVNKKIFEEKKFPSYIKKIPNTLWNRAYWLSRSKVWIDNYRKPYGTRKRKGQFYLQTWHGNIGFKAMGLWRKEGFSKMAYLVSKNDSKMIDAVLNDSEWCREMFPKGMVYDGKFWNTGIPKNDILYSHSKEEYDSFRKNNGLPIESKIIMYAPTFREQGQKTNRSVYVENVSLDWNLLIRTLENKFGGQWYICLRLHPQIAVLMKNYPTEKITSRIIDMSQADDMNMVLAAMDVCITDYSSVAFDAALARKPVFLLCDDLKEYTINRGSMQWIFSEDKNQEVKNNKEMLPGIDVVLPFSVAVTQQELLENIKTFEDVEYNKKVENLFNGVKMIFDGQASKHVVDNLEKVLKWKN